jgi:transitional endoplasmic reticulum ATPase
LGDDALLSFLSEPLKEQGHLPVNIEDDGSFSCWEYDDLIKVIGKNTFIKVIKSKVIPELEKRFKTKSTNTETDKKLKMIKKIFRLSEIELEILTFLFTKDMSSTTKSILEVGDFEGTTSFVNNAGALIGCSAGEIRRAFSKGNFIKSELIEEYRYLEVSSWLHDYLLGITPNLTNSFYSPFKGESLTLKEHLVDKKELNVLSDLLRNQGPCNILLYGEPGTGKTELVKSITKQLGKELCVINNEKHDRSASIKTAVTATCNLTDRKNSIILVDEADELLNTSFSYFFTGEKNSKSWINQFLDENKHKIIWISNRINRIEESTMRRFAFSMKFKKFTLQKKIQVFKYCMKMKGLESYFTEDEVVKLCSRYSINAGGISDALKNLKIRKSSRKQVTLEKLETVLKNHQMAITGDDCKSDRLKEMDQYNAEVLNTSENINRVISIVSGFMKKKTLDNHRSGSMNLLLYGIPGSGKTEFVKYLAKILKKEILYKRGSDLMNHYLGGTEKNIARAFEEAEGDQSILFLDEVDSFLSPRENARNSWEKTQVNELLTQMENFNGVLVCATNFLKGLDQAAMRRFKLKIEFKALSPEGNLKMYKTLLSSLAKKQTLTKEIERDIKLLKHLTPGDFHVVAEKYSYIDECPSHQELIQSLRIETNHKAKAKPIGFAA